MKHISNLVDVVQSGNLTREEFKHRFVDEPRPALIRGGLAEAPAFDLWSWEYLSDRAASQTIRLSYSETNVFNPNQDSGMGTVVAHDTTLREAVEKIFNDSQASGHLYVERLGILEEIPVLMDDLPMPRWIPESCFTRRINLWLGGAGSTTPLHYDSSHNFLGQVRGRKEVTLFAPSETPNLYPAKGSQYEHYSTLNMHETDYDRFPRFSEATGQTVLIQPGDYLYIPPRWWHFVNALERSISVNIWWLTLAMRLQGPARQIARRRAS